MAWTFKSQENIPPVPETPLPVSAEPEEVVSVDAVAHVTIINYGLEALIEIEPPVGDGAPPTMEVLEAALNEAGVVYNVDTEKLMRLVESPVYNIRIPIAMGLAPVNGEDAKIELQFNTDRGKAPKVDEKGKVDFRDLGIVEIAKKGQVLAVITPPTNGVPGISVKGQDMNQLRGKPLPSYVGKNTVLSEDGLYIISMIDGQISYVNKKINVHETYIVKENVDSSTGDLKVAGNLIVYGMVMPGFSIEAGNSIEVRGKIESAKVKAGGDIKLSSGITGSELRCGGDLKGRFIENCTISVRGEMKADYILNSTVNCGKNLKAEGSISKIIGGKYLSGQNIYASSIGSATNVKTRLEIGADPILLERQQVLIASIPKLEKQLEGLKPLYDLLSELNRTNRLRPEKEEVFAATSKQYITCVSQLRALKAELDSITESVMGKCYGKIVCTGTIYPGTSVAIGGASLVINETLVNTSLYYDNGYIGMSFAK